MAAPTISTGSEQSPVQPVAPVIQNPAPTTPLTPATPAPIAPPLPTTPLAEEDLPPVSSKPKTEIGEEQVVIPPPPKTGLSKTILLLVVGLLFLGGIIFAIVKFGLPMLSGTQNKEVNLTWWGLWEDESLAAPIIAEYQASHPNVKISYVKQSHQDYRERLTNALAKGTGPDIFHFHNTWVPMFQNELEPIPSSVISAAEFSQTFYPVAVSDLTVGTGLVGIPLEYDGLALYINQDLFETYGKTIPTTWDDLRQTAIEMTIKDENGVIQQAGVALGQTENVDHWPEILALMMIQNGVKMSKPEGELAEAALTYFTVFSLVDGVWDETLPPSTIAFSSGKLAMYFGPSWRAFEIAEQNPDLRFKIVPVPQLPKTNPSEPDISYASYWVEGVWKKGKNKDVAWDFLKFLSTKDSLQKMYTEAIKTRAFGKPYPRTDMASLISADPLTGAFIKQAPFGRSWYLVSRTFDGPTGINTQINKYFEDGVNAVNQGTRADKALETVAAGVNQVLSQYGIVSPASVSQ